MSETRPKFLYSFIASTILVLTIAVVAAVRIRLLEVPLERDEGEYAYAGQLMLQGFPPYLLAYNMKLPGTYAAYALIMGCFGQTIAGIHLGLLVVNVTTLLLLLFLARRFCSDTAAAVAAAAFGVLSLSPSVYGLAGHATHFVILPAVGGLLLLLRGCERPTPLMIFCSGLLLGLAFIMKQPGILFALLGGVYLAYRQFLAERLPASVALSRVGYFSLGVVLPFAITCAWLAAAGVFDRFWFWTFSYAREYAAILPLREGWLNAKREFGAIFRAAPILWLLVGGGLLCALKLPRRELVFTIGLLLFSFMAVAAGLYFRNHYFILLLPAAALLIGIAVHVSEQWLSANQFPSMLKHVPLLLALLGCYQCIYRDRAVLLALPPRDACRAMYGTNPFPESIEIARYINDRTSPDARVAVLGSEPQIYFYARRHAATGYIYTYALTEPQPFALHMQEEMIREIEQNQPEYVIYVSHPTSWLARVDSHTLLLEWFNEYSRNELRLVGLVERAGAAEAEFIWDRPAQLRIPEHPHFVAVFKRRRADE